MKGILKHGNVRVWALGEIYAIEMDPNATDEELREAVEAEELLDEFRQNAEMN